MNYTELCANVADICENTFTADEYAMFTKQTEQRIYNTVQLPSLRKNVTGTLTANNKYLSAPLDFLSTFSLAVIDPTTQDYTYLLNKDVNFIREAYPNPTTQGTPKHYAIFGPQSGNPDELTLIVGPTPSAAFGAELHYYYYPVSITDPASGYTTWLGDNFDSALFNGTMMEAIRYMKGEPDLVAMYKEQFMQSLTLLKNLGDGKQRMDAYRDGQVRNPVA